MTDSGWDILKGMGVLCLIGIGAYLVIQLVTIALTKEKLSIDASGESVSPQGIFPKGVIKVTHNEETKETELEMGPDYMGNIHQMYPDLNCTQTKKGYKCQAKYLQR